MVLTKQQLQIFRALIEYPWNELTRKQIKEISKEKSNNMLSNAIESFKTNNLINERTIANTKLYSLNFSNELVYSYISIANFENLEQEVKISLNILEECINTPFYSIILFGSRTQNEHTSDSDLDVAIITQKKPDTRTAELKAPLKLDIHTINQKEMQQMLKAKEENLGKQIARTHLALVNPGIFYKIILDTNGFSIQDLSKEVGK